ncbi:hypothetical protein, partial [Allosediminivita pacifica]
MKKKKSIFGVSGFRRSSEPEQFLVAPSQCRMLDVDDSGSGNFGTKGHGESTVVSFGTRDGVYDTYLKRLEDCCRSVGQNVSVETFPAMGAENAFSLKATYIKFKLLTLGKPIVWVDADAVLNAPALLREAREARTSPFPRRTYPTGSVTGM